MFDSVLLSAKPRVNRVNIINKHELQVSQLQTPTDYQHVLHVMLRILGIPAWHPAGVFLLQGTAKPHVQRHRDDH
jgi:hypothetical protein